MKLAFVTDTGTGQHPDYWKEKGIYCLPLQITCDGESKDEYTEITYSEVIQKLHEKMVLKTSLPSLGKIQDCFEELKRCLFEICKTETDRSSAIEQLVNNHGSLVVNVFGDNPFEVMPELEDFYDYNDYVNP